MVNAFISVNRRHIDSQLSHQSESTDLTSFALLRFFSSLVPPFALTDMHRILSPNELFLINLGEKGNLGNSV